MYHVTYQWGGMRLATSDPAVRFGCDSGSGRGWYNARY